MAYAQVQCLGADQGFAISGNTQTLSITLTAGNALAWFFRVSNYGGSTTYTISVADTLGNTYTQRSTYHIGNTGWYWGEAKNITGGSTTITVTISGKTGSDDISYPCLVVWEGSGLDTSAAYVAVAANNYQFSPGTGTDAVVTGTTGTLSGQPAALIAFSENQSANSPPNVGTSFTSAGVFNNSGGASGNESARVEHIRLTATTATTGKFTAITGTHNFLSIGIVLLESTGGGTSAKLLSAISNNGGF